MLKSSPKLHMKVSYLYKMFLHRS